jgi:non-homologous end joining protein Ku
MKCAATASISMIFQTSRSARNYWIGEALLDLASHIIETKKARFDPEKFKDHYQEAVVDLIRARGP